MGEFSTFHPHVRDALAHVNDLPGLRKHPLAALLAGAGSGLSPDLLRQALLGALDQLKPPSPVSKGTVAWRRYRYLYLRYVEGASHEEIARELLVSTRHARRDHLSALDVLASILWDVHLSATGTVGEATDPRGPASTANGIRRRDEVVTSELAQADGEAGEEWADLAEVIHSTIDIAGRVVERLGGQLDVSCPATLPGTRVNRTILRQIILALISYAVESEPGGTIRVTASPGDSVKLTIETDPRDRSGSDRSLRSPVKAETKALLASGQHLAELNGIRVQIARTAARTLCLELDVPVARPRSLLVIDDNPDVARLFERYLTGSDFRLAHAKTWQKALPLAQSMRPDVIILDVMIPSLDGWDILRELKGRSETKDIPVIICSILPERTIAAALGADSFLAKPVSRQSLLAVLRHTLPSRS